MQKRERILSSVVVALVVVVGLNLAWLRVADMFAFRQKQIAALEGLLADRRLELARGADATERLAAWEQRALPADTEIARSRYQSWLVEQVDRVKLQRATVEPSRGTILANVYQSFPFTIRGRGTLEQAVRFLHAVYEVGLLHRVREVVVKPLEGSRELELSFTIEGLMLVDGTAQQLALQPSSRLALASLDDYLKPIVARNLFAPYVPPPPPRQPTPEPRRETPPPPPPPRPSFDAARFAVLTGVLTVGDRPEAWIQLRTTGETIRLAEGDTIEIGSLRGRVLRIGVQHIELDVGGQRLIVQVGKSLVPPAPPARET